MERSGKPAVSLDLLLNLIVSIAIIAFYAAMLILIGLGKAPLGITQAGEVWVLVALVLAAIVVVTPLHRRVRIILTALALIWLRVMALLVVRGAAPPGVTDLKDLWSLVVLALATSGIASNVQVRSRRR